MLTYDTARAETEHVADLLRRAHLEDGIGWSDMAVLVRSGRASIPALRRALTAAGVPVEVAGDETPLVREPAVLPLLGRCGSSSTRRDDPAHETTSAPTVEALLMSPLGGLDATDVRALARAAAGPREVPAAGEPAPRRAGARAVLDPGSSGGPTGRRPAEGRAGPAAPTMPGRCWSRARPRRRSGSCGRAPSGHGGCRAM